MKFMKPYPTLHWFFISQGR